MDVTRENDTLGSLCTVVTSSSSKEQTLCKSMMPVHGEKWRHTSRRILHSHVQHTCTIKRRGAHIRAQNRQIFSFKESSNPWLRRKGHPYSFKKHNPQTNNMQMPVLLAGTSRVAGMHVHIFIIQDAQHL